MSEKQSSISEQPSVQVCPYGCIRRDRREGWHLINQHWKGWNSYSYWFRSLEDLILYGQTQPVERKQDESGVYWTITKGETLSALVCRVTGNGSMNLDYPVVGTSGTVIKRWNDRLKYNQLRFAAQDGTTNCVVIRQDIWLVPVFLP